MAHNSRKRVLQHVSFWLCVRSLLLLTSIGATSVMSELLAKKLKPSCVSVSKNCDPEETLKDTSRNTLFFSLTQQTQITSSFCVWEEFSVFGNNTLLFLRWRFVSQLEHHHHYHQTSDTWPKRSSSNHLISAVCAHWFNMTIIGH